MPFRLSPSLFFSNRGKSAFAFLDPGPLIDQDLQLIKPQRQWIDAVLVACNHPLTIQQDPGLHKTTRQQLLDFLDLCPQGHQKPDPSGCAVPSYHFWMRSTLRPDLPIAGGIGLRVGRTYDLEMFYGHMGYHVYPPARGHHYAERACRLLFPLAARHGLSPLWITCNPDNIASRRTCERLGGQLVEIVPIPEENPLQARGETAKCRYRIDI